MLVQKAKIENRQVDRSLVLGLSSVNEALTSLDWWLQGPGVEPLDSQGGVQHGVSEGAFAALSLHIRCRDFRMVMQH